MHLAISCGPLVIITIHFGRRHYFLWGHTPLFFLASCNPSCVKLQLDNGCSLGNPEQRMAGTCEPHTCCLEGLMPSFCNPGRPFAHSFGIISAPCRHLGRLLVTPWGTMEAAGRRRVRLTSDFFIWRRFRGFLLGVLWAPKLTIMFLLSGARF